MKVGALLQIHKTSHGSEPKCYTGLIAKYIRLDGLSGDAVFRLSLRE